MKFGGLPVHFKRLYTLLLWSAYFHKPALLYQLSKYFSQYLLHIKFGVYPITMK